jgi:hypothetical protein
VNDLETHDALRAGQVAFNLRSGALENGFQLAERRAARQLAPERSHRDKAGSQAGKAAHRRGLYRHSRGAASPVAKRRIDGEIAVGNSGNWE